MLPPMLCELDERSGNGVVVRLLWDSAMNQVLVQYRDEGAEDGYVLDVPPDQALAAFHHPNAFRRAALAVA